MFPGCFIQHARVSANVIHALYHDLSDLGSAARTCTGWAKKVGHRLMTIILSNFNLFKKIQWKVPLYICS